MMKFLLVCSPPAGASVLDVAAEAADICLRLTSFQVQVPDPKPHGLLVIPHTADDIPGINTAIETALVFLHRCFSDCVPNGCSHALLLKHIRALLPPCRDDVLRYLEQFPPGDSADAQAYRDRRRQLFLRNAALLYLIQDLASLRPGIVHFSGHGSRYPAPLELLDKLLPPMADFAAFCEDFLPKFDREFRPQGQPMRMTDLLRALAQQKAPQLVVLNACYSGGLVRRSIGDRESAAGPDALAERFADALAALGFSEPALQLLNETVVPAYTRLGLNTERHVATCKVVRLMLQQGQFDAAFRIFRELDWPAATMIAALREHALTTGHIAHALMQRGAYDEAQRRLREEALPHLHRPSDDRARAALLVVLADICQSQGQPQAALRVLQQEALPTLSESDVDGRAWIILQCAKLQRAGADSTADSAQTRRILRREQARVGAALDALRRPAASRITVRRVAKQDESAQLERDCLMLRGYRWLAWTVGHFADLYGACGQKRAARRLATEIERPVYRALGDLDAVSFRAGLPHGN